MSTYPMDKAGPEPSSTADTPGDLHEKQHYMSTHSMVQRGAEPLSIAVSPNDLLQLLYYKSAYPTDIVVPSLESFSAHASALLELRLST